MTIAKSIWSLMLWLVVAIPVAAAQTPPPTAVNVALATAGTAATSSSIYSAAYAASGATDGDRRGANFGAGGGWQDATARSFPDWVELGFSGARTIDGIAVFSVQDNWKNPAQPTAAMTFSRYGLVDFTVQYWTGTAWQAVPGGVVRGNTLVWRTLTFAAVKTSRIRLLAERASDAWSRVAELEAYEAGTPVPEEPAAGPVEWFVAPGGTGTGSSAAPFGRIQDALSHALPGHVVTVGAGAYAERLSTVRGGQAGQPIVIRAAGARGSVLVTASGRGLTVTHAHLTIEGLVLDGQYGADDAVRVASTGHYFTLRNAEVRRSTRDLVDLGAPRGVLIDGSLIHHALNAAGGRTDAHGIVAGAVEDLTVRNTEIHTFSGDGLQVDPGRAAPGWKRVTIEGCYIWLAPLPAPTNGFAAGKVPGENAVDTKAHSSLTRAKITIRDTIASGFGGGMIANMAAFNIKENVDATIDRVTVFDSEIAFRLRGPTTSSPKGAWVTVTNAVIHDVATAFRYENHIEIMRVWNTTLGSGIVKAFQAASSNSNGLDVRNVLSMMPLPAEAAGEGNLQVDGSSFVNAAAHDYALAAGGLAIDTGVTLSGVTFDRVGTPRPQGGAFDVGAHERSVP